MESKAPAQHKGAIIADLMAGGIDLMRQNLRRTHPDASDREIDSLLRDWLHRRQDPVPGDVAGPVRVRSSPG
jgi:hypothetical protein